MPDRPLHLQGLPDVLLPAAPNAPDAPRRLEIVTGGPRNLADAPLDYRNPFPLKGLDALRAAKPNGPLTCPDLWPLDDDDPDRFGYYANGNAAVGVPGGPETGSVDIFATVRTYAGGWAWALGKAAARPRVRTRTQQDARVPIVSAVEATEGCEVRFTWFAARPDGAPGCAYPMSGNASYRWAEQDPHDPAGVNFFVVARCEAANPTDRPREVLLRTGLAQAACVCAGAFYCGPRYAPPWETLITEPAGAKFRLVATAEGGRHLLGVLDPGAFQVAASEPAIAHWPAPLLYAPPRSAVAELTLRATLAPGASAAACWVIPYFPAALNDAPTIEAVSPETLRDDCLRTWRARHASRTQLRLPEPKVADAFAQALNHLDICSVAAADADVPTPGPSGGHHVFYDRDTPDMAYAFDLVGEKEHVERIIAHYRRVPMHQELSGLVLWLLGSHYALTRDRDWLAGNFDLVELCARWLTDAWAASRDDNDGLLPAVHVGDNELCHGHYVSYHLYALSGARHAAALARALGRDEQRAAWTGFHDAFGREVRRHIADLLTRTGGVLTPTFEGFDAPPIGHDTDTPRTGAYGWGGGCDWHNLAAVFPTGVLDPHDPAVTSSLRRWRHAYVEGIFPYPSDSNYAELHNYNVLNLSGTWLRRGDWAETVRDLYGVLLHTTATHASGECVETSMRWDHNNCPHNWFSGKFVRFVRDMLAYEGRDDRLHLLGGLSPAWMSPGESLVLEGAPTTLGPLSMSADMRDAGLQLTLDFAPRADCRGVILHLPPFCREATVTTDRGPAIRADADDGGWRLPAGAAEVQAAWTPCDLPGISFRAVVDSYLADYRRRVGARRADEHA